MKKIAIIFLLASALALSGIFIVEAQGVDKRMDGVRPRRECSFCHNDGGGGGGDSTGASPLRQLRSFLTGQKSSQYYPRRRRSQSSPSPRFPFLRGLDLPSETPPRFLSPGLRAYLWEVTR